MDGEANLAARGAVQIRMRCEKRLRLGGGRVAKAVDIMMAVALGMGDADQRAERKILLHGKARLAGEVLAGDEEFRAARAPFRRAGRIDDRLVDALAGFRGDAAIAERARHREGVVGIVGFVDDEIAAAEPVKRRLPGNIARHRLLDIQKLGRDRLQRGITVEPVNQRAQRGEIGVLLVGVERDLVFIRQRGEFAADADQARGVVFRITVELELEIARAGVFFRIGDAALAFNLVVEPDRMPDGDALQPLAASQKAPDLLVAQAGRQPRVDAGDVFGHAVEEIRTGCTQQRIQDRLVDLRRAIGGGERRDILLCASLDLPRETGRVQPERGLKTAMRQIKLARDDERAPQLADGVFRREMCPLVEPFRHQELGAGAGCPPFAFNLDLDPHESLARGVDDNRAKAERPDEIHRSFEKGDISYGQSERHLARP